MSAEPGATENQDCGFLEANLLSDPASAEFICSYVRTLDTPEEILRWYKRYSTLQIFEERPEINRQALLAAAEVSIATLRRFANSVQFPDRRIHGFVGAALLIKDRKIMNPEPLKPVYLKSANDEFEKVFLSLFRHVVPTTIKQAYHLAISKQNIASMLKGSGFNELAENVNKEYSIFSRRIRKNLYNTQFRFFTNQWVFAIGHMVNLIYLVKGVENGILDYDIIKIWKSEPANTYLFSEFVTKSEKVKIVDPWTNFADNYRSSYFEWIDGKFVNNFESCGIIEDAIGKENGAILSRPNKSIKRISDFLYDIGISASTSIATLHCREQGFRNRPSEELRNSNPLTCIAAIRRLIDKGYQVIRLGDSSMTPFPQIDGLFDYARSALKTPELDVLLPAVADLHIGSSSGLSLVPQLFGTPTLYLNWYPLDLVPWGRRNSTVAKPITSLKYGRRIVDRSTYLQLAVFRSRRLLQEFGHDAQNLNAEEIDTAVAGFVEDLQQRAGRPPKIGPNISRVLIAHDDGQLRDLT